MTFIVIMLIILLNVFILRGFRVMAILTAELVSNYFLSLLYEEGGDTLSNLKLQKLLYYAQGLHLAYYGKPLFSEQIRAWMHGPVVPAIYRKYMGYGSGSIPKPTGLDFDSIKHSQKDFLNEIWTVFGQFSGWKLYNMVHGEEIWKGASPNCVIKRDIMRKFFKKYIRRRKHP